MVEPINPSQTGYRGVRADFPDHADECPESYCRIRKALENRMPLFKHLKTNGYNLEDLNLKDTGKNLLMMAIGTTAYVLAIWENWKEQKQNNTQVYKNGSEWAEVSIFREGLAILTAKCFRFIDFIRYVLKALSPKNHAIFKNVQ